MPARPRLDRGYERWSSATRRRRGDGHDHSDGRGWVRTEQANAYVAYITGTGLREYAATPGNLGCQMWTTDLGDGRTEVLTVSWWESRAAIIGFAGSDIEAAVFYPEDDEYLVDRETTVSHFEVAAAQAG